MPCRLEVRGLVMAFGAAFRLGPIDFEADRGILYVEGPNGSGKTTLLRMLCGELLPTGGRALIEGEEVHRSIAARRRIALVPSAPELPGFLAVREAWEFVASIRGTPHWDGAAFCAALDIDPKLRLQHASAGERKKAELVCGLAGDPPILLLDETFAHLDAAARDQLREWIVDWSKSRLIVLTHHGTSPVPPDSRLILENGGCRFEQPTEVSE